MRRTHTRLRCDGCQRPALALYAYLAPFDQAWLCADCVRYADEHGLIWRPVTVTEARPLDTAPAFML